MPSDRLTRTDSLPSDADDDGVVGVDAVEVRHDGVDVDRLAGHRSPRRAGRSRGRSPAVLGVDLDGRALGTSTMPMRPKKRCRAVAEAGGIHHVEGAGLEVVRFAVLPPRPVRRGRGRRLRRRPVLPRAHRKPYVSIAQKALSKRVALDQIDRRRRAPRRR